MPKTPQGTIVYQEEGQRLLDAVSDKVTRDLVGVFLTVLYRETQQGTKPRTDIDYEFLAKILIKFCEKHDLIGRVLDGTDEGWPE